MNRGLGGLAVALFAAGATAALGACFDTTWAPLHPGTRPARDKVILVGTIEIVPPVDRDMPGGGGSLMVGPPRDRALAIFTPDRSEPLSRWQSMERKDTVWIPYQGGFFIETPARGTTYLRGLVIATNRGSTTVDIDVRIDIKPDDHIVYVGHLLVLRAAPARVEVKDQKDAALAEARNVDHDQLAELPWTTRLATPAH